MKKTDTGKSKMVLNSRAYSMLLPVAAFLLRTVCPVRYSGLENITCEAPFILIGNHLSFMDPILLAAPLKKLQVTFLAKKELSRVPVLSALLKMLHPIYVDRHASDMEAMRSCLKVLKEGGVLGIFPEGTRAFGGTMEHVESGVALMALRSKVPVVPAYISGKVKLFSPLKVCFDKPIDMDDLRQEGVNNDTCSRLVERITLLYKDYASACAAPKE